MTWFVLLLVVLTAAAVALLTFPLLRRRRAVVATSAEANLAVYRDQFAELERDLSAGSLTADQYQQAHDELERRMLDDVDQTKQSAPAKASRSNVLVAVAVGVAVPVCAALLYLRLGDPQALNAPKQAVDASNITVDQFKQMTQQLAAKLKAKPDDPVGWLMLGRAYKALQQYPDAIAAFQRAEQLDPRSAEVLVEHAEAVGFLTEGRLDGEPTQLLERALAIAPNHEKGLTLAGTAAFARGDYPTAIRYWQQLSANTPPESELGRALATGIAEAKARSGGKAPQVAAAPRRPPDASKTADANGAKTISGVVKLSPALAAGAGPEETVFIFARAAQGPKMPLAVLRKQVKDLPLKFQLDDSMAMSPGLELSSFPRVVVAARISKSGSATPAPGDLEGASQPVEPGAKGVAVIIDRPIR